MRRPQTRWERAQDIGLTLASLVAAPLAGAAVGLAIGGGFALAAVYLVIVAPDGPHMVDVPDARGRYDDP